jgi:hypothetical protein
MKNRLLLLVLILVLSASYAIAQERSKTSLAILGGVSFQNMNGKLSSGDDLDNDMLLGYHAGINVQIPIVAEFYLQPGFLYTLKGAKSTYSAYTETTKIGYLEMPLDLVYKIALGNGYFVLGVGPYAAYGINGNVKEKGNSVTVDRDIKFKNVVDATDPLTTPYYKAFDMGANAFVGIETSSGLFLQLETQFGLIDINPEDKRILTDKSSKKNTGFGLSLGYRF